MNCPDCEQKMSAYQQGIYDLQYLCPDCDKEVWIKDYFKVVEE